MPIRIQMTRKKGGWRKDHPDAVIVARPSKWGNPFEIGKDGTRQECVDLFDRWMRHQEPMWADNPPDAAELRGKDLACWCPLDQPCHADVLLKIANEDA